MVQIDISYLSKLETGKMPPPAVSKVVQLAKALRVDPDELFQLAKKVPPTWVRDAIAAKPQVLRFLRAARRIDAKKLEKLIEEAERKPS